MLCENGHDFRQWGKESYVPPSRVRDNEPGYVPPERRMRHSMRRGSAKKHEENHHKLVAMEREMVREKGRGKAEDEGMRRTHRMLPEEVHYRREVDPNYFDDPKNLNKHTDCQVDDI